MMFLVNYVLMTMMMTSIRCNAKFTLTYRWWARIHGWFWDPKTSLFLFLTEAECPSYTAVHHRQSGLPCCCCPYLEQSAPTCHVRTFYVCFPKSPQGFSLQAGVHSHNFYRNFCSACAVTIVIFGHFNRSFLLTYLVTYLCNDTKILPAKWCVSTHPPSSSPSTSITFSKFSWWLSTCFTRL